MNMRVRDLILGWLKDKGLAPDAKSEYGKAGLGHHHRYRLARRSRALLSPLFVLAQAMAQQERRLLAALQGAGVAA